VGIAENPVFSDACMWVNHAPGSARVDISI